MWFVYAGIVAAVLATVVAARRLPPADPVATAPASPSGGA
jgi:hypothetical protein